MALLTNLDNEIFANSALEGFVNELLMLTAFSTSLGADEPAPEKAAAPGVELADGEGALGAGVGFGDRLDLGCREGLMGLGRAAGEAEGRNPDAPQYCDACFSGQYPVAPSDKIEEGFQMKAAE